MPVSIRVGLVDFDEGVRSGRKMIIESDSSLQFVFESSGSLADIEAISLALIDVIVIDQRLELGSGIDFYSALRDSYGSNKEAPFAVLTMPFDSPGITIRALEAGFSHCVSLQQGPEALVLAVNDSSNDLVQFNLSNLESIILGEDLKQQVNLDFVYAIDSLPKSVKSIIPRIRESIKKMSSGSDPTIDIDSLNQLRDRIGHKTSAETLIKLHRSGLLDGN